MSLLENLTREFGRDAGEVVLEMYPEYKSYSPAAQQAILDAVERVMEIQGYPKTAHYAAQAHRFVQATIESNRLAELERQPETPPVFIPKSPEVEADFFNDPNTTAEDIKRYMQAKHGAR